MKANPKPWLYGPNWQGIRCEARTRRGTLCQRPARLPVGRCKLHGGASTGSRPRKALRDSRRLKPSMGSTPKRREQRLGALQRRGVRGAANLRSWRRGSWTTGIWTRTGGIGSNKGLVIAGSWHWTNCLGGYCGLPQGQVGMLQGGAPKQVPRSLDHGPIMLVPQIRGVEFHPNRIVASVP
jgi:hypothetical protein